MLFRSVSQSRYSKLVVGNKYELKSAIIGSWSTKIQLTFMPKDIPYFNSVFFKFYSDEGIELDITNREVVKTYSHILVFE